ncbi:interferon regulatory factor 1-like isoform X1 [Carassius gibelio]|uniref:interferon regulatory factor 1-like isoform X1 n=1 Tax=Carassius gibelio TaxID=101364 RepID=UPI002277A6FA|nr:interferon regulatory factor 1-like isoform X1 [Carassius gibelio]
MPVSRMRMRPWLEVKIDSNTIAGLRWVNKEEKMFSIPWKHAARHGWEVDKDACLFKQWAIHTGKYKEGETQPDPKTWKANFRCAMNSLPDIEEVKDKSVNKGCGAVRVYRMLPAIAKKKVKRCKGLRKRKVKLEEMDAEEMQSEMTQENTIDSTVNLSTISTSNDTPAYEMEIPNCPEDLYKFQVSPVHSTDLEENEAIFELTRQLERESTQWMQSNFVGKGFLGNEVATTESLSPESQWSESSGEELEFRLYTELTPDLREDSLCTYTELWNSNSVPQTMCPL